MESDSWTCFNTFRHRQRDDQHYNNMLPNLTTSMTVQITDQTIELISRLSLNQDVAGSESLRRINESSYLEATNNAMDEFDLPAIILAASLCVIILLTIVGNVFVVIAILTEKHLQKPQNYLILSLAFADLGIGIFVLPLSAVYEVTQRWTYGSFLCEAWIFLDVAGCSASILHLVGIATDRYRSITDVRYSRQRKTSQIVIMIILIWMTSVVVGAAPFSGWKDVEYYDRIQNLTCLISQDAGYQVFSTTIAFYIPLVVIVIVYSWIYRATKKRIQGRMQSPQRKPSFRHSKEFRGSNSNSKAAGLKDSNSNLLTTNSPSKSAANGVSDGQYRMTTRQLAQRVCEDLSTTEVIASGCHNPALTCSGSIRRRRNSVEAKRERKAFRMVSIVTGSFVVCWLPFFLIALIRALCDECPISNPLAGFFAWLGWSNSFINPMIYTVFSPDFRFAFKKIIWRAGTSVGCLDPLAHPSAKREDTAIL